MKHIDISEKNRCCGCGACAYTCPADAIRFETDGEGFVYPRVDPQRCVNCGKCVKSCSMQSEQPLSVLPVQQQYGAKHKNDAVRAQSRSGGVFTAISDWVLKQGGHVYGAVQTNPTFVKHLCADVTDMRNKMRGSKYVQSDTIGVYGQIAADLKRGTIVLFSGTPCQCAAVRKVIGEDPKLYLCDILCHGVASPMVWKDYLLWIEKKYKSCITEAIFRDKEKYPYEDHVEKIVVGDKPIYSKRFAELYGKNVLLRPSCYVCPYTTPNRVSDFTIADYWGISKFAPLFNDGKGVSLFMLRTLKAQALFAEIVNELDVLDTMEHMPTHYNLKRPTACPEMRDAFWQAYGIGGFSYVSRKYGGYDLLRRIKKRLIDRIN